MWNAAKLFMVGAGLIACVFLAVPDTRPSGAILTESRRSASVADVDAGSMVDRPLRALMVGLGQDMARISDGIWHEDFPMIEQGAQAVATHPKITADEIAAIKSALGNRFPQFVSFDGIVHTAAVELIEAAKRTDMQRVLGLQNQIRQGCVSCHAAFRREVRHALIAVEGQR